MFIILGASGNIGSRVTEALRQAGKPVLAVVHSAEKADAIRADLVEPVVVDLRDNAALERILQRGKRAFLLNPPGDPAGDSNAEELGTARSITSALNASGLGKVVLASTYGAQPGDGIGDLSTLHEFECLALASGIPVAINRGAYYFTNLDMLAEAAGEGVLPTAFPADLALPMVALDDLAAAAVERLVSGVEDVGIKYVEGPARYSFSDVAASFARHLGRTVSVQTTPRDQWEESFRAVGFSEVSARSFARMTAATLDKPDLPSSPTRGRVTLDDYIAGLVS
ncbi:MAG: NAD(P)H-binding protein [Candidatus Devosia phytovorans]|uniref:NAD(P)H-binding protein n=1 Tax=Candidatus Devosia phytovorans TaxID=3121372 RepID=A0AAJ5VZN6_9HYPH|nr:NAD(P)H-binding protein [Devosia sp.]WEK06424.1 MAG: NAD(P)H-binding protein [Devosia sp.]